MTTDTQEIISPESDNQHPIVSDEVKTQVKEFCQTIENIEGAIEVRQNELNAQEDKIRDIRLQEIATERNLLKELAFDNPLSQSIRVIKELDAFNSIHSIELVQLIKSIEVLTEQLSEIDVNEFAVENELLSLLNEKNEFVDSEFYKSITEN
tara:strand:+ start:241 stop:696 length:456 start_codon:yes stop_codon:yes gene_type:complete